MRSCADDFDELFHFQNYNTIFIWKIFDFLSILSTLPSPLPEIARAILLAYFLEYFRSFYGFEREINNILGRGFGLIGIYLIIEAVLLKWVIHHARKNGTFIKLSE